MYIYQTKVTGAGIARLGRLKDLETLNLGGTGVGDAGLSVTGGMTKLRKLDIGKALNQEGAPITDAGMARSETLRAGELNLWGTLHRRRRARPPERTCRSSATSTFPARDHRRRARLSQSLCESSTVFASRRCPSATPAWPIFSGSFLA